VVVSIDYLRSTIVSNPTQRNPCGVVFYAGFSTLRTSFTSNPAVLVQTPGISAGTSGRIITIPTLFPNQTLYYEKPICQGFRRDFRSDFWVSTHLLLKYRTAQKRAYLLTLIQYRILLKEGFWYKLEK
jgi:hypothetical protein